jgi:hypothetical protein
MMGVSMHRSIVGSDCNEPSISILVDCPSKHFTLNGCIAAGPYQMKSFVILYGCRPWTLTLLCQKRALIADGVSFPSIEQRRKEEDDHGRAMSLMDGLGANHMNAFIENDVLSFLPYSQSNKIAVITASILSRVEPSSRSDKDHLSIHPEGI